MLHLKKILFIIILPELMQMVPPAGSSPLGAIGKGWTYLYIIIIYIIYYFGLYPKSNLDIDIVAVLYTGLKRCIGKAEMRKCQGYGRYISVKMLETWGKVFESNKKMTQNG